MKKLVLLLISITLNSQNINLNNDFLYENLRTKVLNGDLKTKYSFNIRPLNSDEIFDEFKFISKNKSKSVTLKFLGIDFFTEYNSNYPYKRNNGSMLPNRGYQHIISPGIFFNIGPLSIKFKPEHHFGENKSFNGFSENHYPEIWAKRYILWNQIDMPERFGEKSFNRLNLGQSSIRLNWKNYSLGFSNENIWWGPSFRNSIMMSNNSEGFNHITFNNIKPVKTFFGFLEWQFITGKLISSGFNPPNADYEFAGTKLFVPKINQMSETDDWRFLQGFILSISPKWVDGLSFGLIRWVQMYSALIKGRYTWMEGSPNYFPAFQNLFRKNDKYGDYEAQTNQAAGIFFKWHWKDSKAEFYVEFHHNDSKVNLRDLLLDSDHSRATTLGMQKIFNVKQNKFLFNWEWTSMEQTGSRLVRNAGSWYEHGFVRDGYTNKGEVLGSSIGPGSNSHYISLSRIRDDEKIGIAFELIQNDNDFYTDSFSSAQDYRRYWKDLNFHLNFNKKINNLILSSNLIYIRSLNYQWELDNTILPDYHPGNDKNNFHMSLKVTYLGSW